MKIRKSHAIKDRIKLIFALLIVLIAMIFLVKILGENRRMEKTATIETFLETALKPIGSTMYIWGGGWNVEDDGSGASSTYLGLNPQWEIFAQAQDESYDFENHRYERENGLDCSGFVGWVLYNTFESQKGQEGYVTLSTEMAQSMAERGWGRLICNPKKFLPGDIVSMEGHVWICLGTCQDGSVLLVHSSPPGVSVCGTALSTNQGNQTESQAVKLATQYMKERHPKWQEKYPNREVSVSYLKEVTVFRWSKSSMLDAQEYQKKSAEEILGILSPDM